jgi:hypothetical protein
MRELNLTTAYGTFGVGHRHELAGHVFDGDEVVKIVTRHDPRDVMFALFGPVFCTTYDEMPAEDLARWYPRGLFQISDEDLTKYGIDPLTLQKLPPNAPDDSA